MKTLLAELPATVQEQRSYSGGTTELFT